MRFPLTIAIGGLAAALALSAVTSTHEGFRETSFDARAQVEAAAEDTPIWRTDLAAAMAEARRTKRPLLAVFR